MLVIERATWYDAPPHARLIYVDYPPAVDADTLLSFGFKVNARPVKISGLTIPPKCLLLVGASAEKGWLGFMLRTVFRKCENDQLQFAGWNRWLNEDTGRFEPARYPFRPEVVSKGDYFGFANVPRPGCVSWTRGLTAFGEADFAELLGQ